MKKDKGSRWGPWIQRRLHKEGEIRRANCVSRTCSPSFLRLLPRTAKAPHLHVPEEPDHLLQRVTGLVRKGPSGETSLGKPHGHLVAVAAKGGPLRAHQADSSIRWRLSSNGRPVLVTGTRGSAVRLPYAPRRVGSRTSRSQSPTRLTTRAVSMRTSPGKAEIHQAESR